MKIQTQRTGERKSASGLIRSLVSKCLLAFRLDEESQEESELLLSIKMGNLGFYNFVMHNVTF